MPVARSVIVILGPTASGKSRLGVRLAKKFRGVVVSADSRQVYRGLPIGTGQITRRDMNGIRHYLLATASARGQYSVARYVRQVGRVLRTVPSARPIFLVGGSPFYLKAVTEANSFSSVPPNPLLRRRLAVRSTRQLFQQLARLDPARAKTIDPANRRRIIRAIEIASHLTSLRPAKSRSELNALPPMRVLKIGLRLPRHELFRRIDRQVEQRLRRGMMAETKRAHRRGLPWSRLAALGLEYREIVRTIRGQASVNDLPQRMKSVTRDFARRQMTWWKRDLDIRWVSSTGQAEGIIRRWI